MTQQTTFLFLAAALAMTACAEVQRIPEEPRFTAPQAERRAAPKPVTEQSVGIAVRHVARPMTAPVTTATAVTAPAQALVAPVTTAAAVTAPAQALSAPMTTAAAVTAPVKVLEAKLSGVPVCNDLLVERMDGVQPVRQVLGQEDEILMWSAYGGAGLVAVLTTIGMARGQDPGRGVLLFGIYGLPLAGIGAFESWRSRTLDEPLPPRYSKTRALGEMPCPEGSDALPVRMVLGPQAHADFALAPTWTPVPGGERLTATYAAETTAPILLRDGRLTAFLGAPRPAEETPAPVTASAPATTSAPALIPAAAVAAPAAPPSCESVAKRSLGSGWLPKAFFEQPVREAKLRDGVALEDFAAAELGGKQYLWQVEELNPGLKKALQGARPIKLNVPVQVKSASDWKSLLPPSCE